MNIIESPAKAVKMRLAPAGNISGFELMSRPKKPRQCGCRLAGRAFKPSGRPMSELERIDLAPDELEALKLCDYDGLFQDQAGEKMGVSRGTVQRLLASARQKVARALVEGSALVMAEGGECE